MEIRLSCGGTFEPFSIGAKARTYRCSLGCRHAVSEDLRQLVVEDRLRSGANETVNARRESERGWKRWAGWGVGIGSLGGLDYGLNALAASPDSAVAAAISTVGPWVAGGAALTGLIAAAFVFTRQKIRMELDSGGPAREPGDS
jgi:hypothetical protein